MKSKNIKKGGVRGLMLLLPLLLLSMASCVKEPAVTTLPDVPEGMVRIDLYTNSADYQKPVTRATNENSVYGVDRMPWVFIFDAGTGAYLESAQAELAGGQPYVTLTARTSPVAVVVLANAPTRFSDGTADYDFNPTGIAAFFAANGNNITAVETKMQTVRLTAKDVVPYNSGCLIMYGTTTLSEVSTTTTIGSSGSLLFLDRFVAKVTIENEAANFTFKSWTVINVNDRQGVAEETDYGSTISFNPDIAAPADIFYVHYTNKIKKPAVIVKGTYGDKDYWYKLAFRYESGEAFTVYANWWYKFKIETVVGPGFGSFTEAEAGPPSNNITAKVDVIDLSSHDIIDNGEYYLGVSNSEFIAYSGDALTGVVAVTVTTNATATMGITTRSVTATRDVGTGSFAVSPASLIWSDGTNPGVTTLIFSNFDAGVTEGTITIKLGNLQKEIKVKRGGANLISGGGLSTLGSLPITSAIVDPEATSWLSLDVNGDDYTDYTNPDNSAEVTIGFKTESNDGEGASKRSGIAYMTSRNAGRTMYYVVQNAPPPTLAVSPEELNFGYSAGTKTISVTSNTTWNVTSTQPSWCTVSPTSGSLDDSFTVTTTANGGAERKATITVKSGDGTITRTINVTQDPPGGGSADVLYFATDGTLQCGKIGSTTTSFAPYTFKRADMAFFQFGSVVGFTNNGDTWSDSHVKFNPVNPGGTYGYTSIPRYNNEGGEPMVGVEGYITDTWHTADNVIAGKGDPCKLVGLTAQQVKDRHGNGTLATYDSGWRLPTANENVDFIGAPTIWHGSTNNPGLPHSECAFWAENPGVIPVVYGGWFPIPGNIHQTTGRKTRQQDPAGFLPAAGFRDGDGVSTNQGAHGRYASSTVRNTANGYVLTFNAFAVSPRYTGGIYTMGVAVRCVKQ